MHLRAGEGGREKAMGKGTISDIDGRQHVGRLRRGIGSNQTLGLFRFERKMDCLCSMPKIANNTKVNLRPRTTSSTIHYLLLIAAVEGLRCVDWLVSSRWNRKGPT